MTIRRRAGVCLLAAALAAGCAARRTPPPSSDLERAASLVGDGCYRCLEAAAALLRGSASQDQPALLRALFELELLLVLRERELGIDAAPTLARARALLPRLTVQAREVADLAAAVPVDDGALPTRDRNRFLAEHRTLRQQLAPTLQRLPSLPLSPQFGRYLARSLECAYSLAPEESIPADEAASGLLAYRAAWCRSVDASALERLRERVPQFTETAFLLARHEMRLPQGARLWRAIQLLDEAAAAFPDSISVRYLGAQARQATGDCRGAVPQFEQVIARQPTHERALLGRAVCLSYLGQHQAAVEAATELIAGEPPNMGDGFYWRAWNRRRLQDLARATEDIERAKSLIYSENVLTLAGMIHYDHGRLDAAVTDLTAAKAANRAGRNCTAMWYLALIDQRRERWLTSGSHFVDASGCYQRNITETEQRLADLQSQAGLAEAFRASQLSILTVALQDDRGQKSAAAFNAAVQFVRGGDRASASAQLEVAALDPARASQVAELRQQLK